MNCQHQQGVALPIALGLAAAVAALASVLHYRARDVHQSTGLDDRRLGAWHAADSAEAWARTAWRIRSPAPQPREPERPATLQSETLELGPWRVMIQRACDATGCWTLDILVVGLGHRQRFERPW